MTMRGGDDPRMLPIEGEKSAVLRTGNRDDPSSRWLQAQVEPLGRQKA